MVSDLMQYEGSARKFGVTLIFLTFTYGLKELDNVMLLNHVRSLWSFILVLDIWPYIVYSVNCEWCQGVLWYEGD